MNDYIIHLVASVDRLVEILHMGFVPNFHKEVLSTFDNHNLILGIPMTSFTDLPVGDLSEMMEVYGSYGIMMSKEWALSQSNLSPVHYIADDDFLVKIADAISNGKIELDFLKFTKRYISEWKGSPYCNYKEREWRHAISNTVVPWFKTERNYNEWRGLSEQRPKPTQLLIDNSLRFNPEDVVGLILKDERDRDSLIEMLENTTDKNLSQWDFSEPVKQILDSIVFVHDLNKESQREMIGL